MIREHAFNSRWWESPVGFVESAAFFSLPAEEQQARLSPFAWAEFRSPIESAPPLRELQRAGFMQFDTQVDFRINLHRMECTASMDELHVRFADEHPFMVPVQAPAAFRHERFQHVPGVTAAKLDERYRLWANELIARQPACCVEVVCGDAVQGWFLSETDDTGLHLCLSMAHHAARISGMYVYQRALLAFAQRGARLGHARFSIANVAVHNIYARLGAVFRQSLGCWLWVRADV